MNWQTSTPGCTISGAPGSQTLNCSLGDNFNEGATFTAVVSAVTSTAQCTAMNNTAIATRDQRRPGERRRQHHLRVEDHADADDDAESDQRHAAGDAAG